MQKANRGMASRPIIRIHSAPGKNMSPTWSKTMLIMAMIFSNIHLIVKTAEGDTWFSTGATPFQPDNVRMVREIGIFLIMIYVVGLIIEAGAYIACQDVEGSTTMMPLAFGIIVICLSKMFEYGQKLQETEDGLI